MTPSPALFADGLPFPEGPCFDRDGNPYVVDFGAGNISRVGPSGPNDLAFDQRGRLYFTDPHGSNEHNSVGRVVRIDVDGSFHTVLEGMAYPNGLAFDATDTSLYVAHMPPDGSLERDIAMPGDRPTNVAFGGSDRRTLFITEVETSSVYTLAVETPGLPLFAEHAWAPAGVA